jgi:hypothetical protein
MPASLPEPRHRSYVTFPLGLEMKGEMRTAQPMHEIGEMTAQVKPRLGLRKRGVYFRWVSVMGGASGRKAAM